MRTTVSVPDWLFRAAEQYPHQVGKSRSQVYAEALRFFLLRHSPDAVTRAMNAVCDKLGDQDNAFAGQAARQLLYRKV